MLQQLPLLLQRLPTTRHTRRTQLITSTPPHTNPLHPPQNLQPPHQRDGRKNSARHADAPEPEIGFFDEVFQVHAVEGGDECSGSEAEGHDGEAEFEEH